MRRRGLIIAALVIVALVVFWVFLSYRLSLRTMTISFKNISSVSVYKSESLDSGNNPKPIKVVSGSGTVLKLPKGSYALYYKGKPGYESLYKYIYLYKNGQSFDLNPEYSQESLDKIRKQELPAILKSISNKYSNIGLYDIKPGEIYNNGSWYGTTLVYKGGDVFNSDTLRIVLHKEGGVWVVKTDPPDIVLSKFRYNNIPEAVLNKVNSQ